MDQVIKVVPLTLARKDDSEGRSIPAIQFQKVQKENCHSGTSENAKESSKDQTASKRATTTTTTATTTTIKDGRINDKPLLACYVIKTYSKNAPVANKPEVPPSGTSKTADKPKERPWTLAEHKAMVERFAARESEGPVNSKYLPADPLKPAKVRKRFPSVRPITFVCTFCDQVFGTRDARATHERTHTGERPYHCGYCDQRFPYRHLRAQHERTHAGAERPHRCAHCGKRYEHRNRMNEHEKTHKVRIPYLCAGCEDSSTEEYKVIWHDHNYS